MSVEDDVREMRKEIRENSAAVAALAVTTARVEGMVTTIHDLVKPEDFPALRRDFESAERRASDLVGKAEESGTRLRALDARVKTLEDDAATARRALRRVATALWTAFTGTVLWALKEGWQYLRHGGNLQ